METPASDKLCDDNELRTNHEELMSLKRDRINKCTSVFILCLRVRSANSIMLGTAAILGNFDTLRIFSSSTDAARIKQ